MDVLKFYHQKNSTFLQHTLSAIAQFCLAGASIFPKIFFLFESPQFTIIGNYL